MGLLLTSLPPPPPNASATSAAVIFQSFSKSSTLPLPYFQRLSYLRNLSAASAAVSNGSNGDDFQGCGAAYPNRYNSTHQYEITNWLVRESQLFQSLILTHVGLFRPC